MEFIIPLYLQFKGFHKCMFDLSGVYTVSTFRHKYNHYTCVLFAWLLCGFKNNYMKVCVTLVLVE